MKRILIAGATGYVGRRLFEKVSTKSDLSLRLLVRNRGKLSASSFAKAEVVEGDTFNKEILARALQEVDVAYYLIHSMGKGKTFSNLDRESAENFREACLAAGVKRIIYLGGLGVKETASKHLISRIETGEILSSKPGLQTIWFRAGVIIGSGSASFEILNSLIQKLPLMITPTWVNTRTQPISIEDVLDYLVAALEVKTIENISIDIGAPPLSFREMLSQAAHIMGLTRYIFPVPVLTPKLSSYWLIFFTPIPFQMAAALVEGLKSETLVLNDHASTLFPHIIPQSYKQAVTRAMVEMEESLVVSRWCDSSADSICDVDGHDDTNTAILRDIRVVAYQDVSQEKVFQAVCSIGGKNGWFTYDFLWRLRGFIDKLSGGYGLNRGRRSGFELRIGDALDFWKVVDVKEGKRLLLVAQMKVPGKAWLEFDVQPDKLVQTAHFYPRGLWGRLYWFLVTPLHNLVFANLAQSIVQKARQAQ